MFKMYAIQLLILIENKKTRTFAGNKNNHIHNNNLMKKYLLIITSVTLGVISCNQASRQTSTVTPAVTDSAKKAVDTPATEMLQVSGLSPAELKDDPVFTDGSIPTSWQNAGITDVKGLKLFIKKLQQWIVTNDKDSLASVVKYPLNKKIKTKEELVANYDAVFTKEVKLSFATLNFSQLFRNDKGVMTSGGKVWFDQQGSVFKIIAINP